MGCVQDWLPATICFIALAREGIKKGNLFSLDMCTDKREIGLFFLSN